MKKVRNKEHRRANRILALIFIGILIVFFVINIVRSPKETSALENRSLAQRPVLTWQSVTSGTYMERFESFESDQFVGRNAFREIYTWLERVGGKHESNGVYIGRKHQLMEDIAVPDEDILIADIEGINNYAQTYTDISVHFLLVPDTAQVYPDRLPVFASVADQKALFERFRAQLDDSIVWMDAVSALENHTDEKLYYQTDHHWTTEGAYQVFLETAGDLGISDPYETEYESYCAAGDFNGTLASTSGFLLGRKEELDVYLPTDVTSYLVTYVEEQERTPSIYSTDELDTRDKYAVFMGGNHSLVEIETASESNKVLLVVKDSFANCYIPFLIPYYNKIIVVDPRYYVGGIEELTYTYGITDTLFLYSGNTFFTDTNLKSFLSVD